METIHVSADFTAALGKIKPMHSVNNGPASLRGSSNARYFTDAAIPFADLQRQLSDEGVRLGVAIHAMHEDIFRAMHEI